MIDFLSYILFIFFTFLHTHVVAQFHTFKYLLSHFENHPPPPFLSAFVFFTLDLTLDGKCGAKSTSHARFCFWFLLFDCVDSIVSVFFSNFSSLHLFSFDKSDQSADADADFADDVLKFDDLGNLVVANFQQPNQGFVSDFS